MTNKVYTIMDIIAEESGPPFIAKNDGIAQRQFYSLLSAQKVNQDEYDLYEIGQYNPETMILTSIVPKKVQITLNSEAFSE